MRPASDGSVMILAPLATMTLYPRVYKNLRYDPLQDFVPVSTISAVTYVVTVGPKVPLNVKALADFVAWCRANPEQATYGSPGAGSPLHFTGLQLGLVLRMFTCRIKARHPPLGMFLADKLHRAFCRSTVRFPMSNRETFSGQKYRLRRRGSQAPMWERRALSMMANSIRGQAWLV